MPRAVLILEVQTLLATLPEPEWLVLADSYNIEPRVARFVVSKCEDNVDLLERAECGLWVEEVNDRNDGEICRSKDDPGAVANVVECNRSNEHNTVKESVKDQDGVAGVLT